MLSKQKLTGAYFTPDAVAATLVHWAAIDSSSRMLDPSCGDGRFIAFHRNSVGVEHDLTAASKARLRAPDALVQNAEFFRWSANTSERFDCAAGNPPFIRYQSFSGEIRSQAILLCRALGVHFSGLASSWAPFLVVTASMLKVGGRMAFVVPAEIGHAPYAAPLLQYLADNFTNVELVAVKHKLFPDLSEDCWLLYAEGFGGRTDEIGLAAVDGFAPTSCPPRGPIRVSIRDWKTNWNSRLRPFLLPASTRELYRCVARASGSTRFGDVASINIGYVTGANEFFHLRPSTAQEFDIPTAFLHPSVRNGRSLVQGCVTNDTVEMWAKADAPSLLLKLPQTSSLPPGVMRYLDTERAHAARTSYKCRMRKPWYSVPDVKVPDFFLTYMSGLSSQLVRNDAGCVCTNALHAVKIRNRAHADNLMKMWDTPFVRLSCEIEGHPLGGGMLKLEPREAGNVIVPSESDIELTSDPSLEAGLNIMRSWRHYDT